MGIWEIQTIVSPRFMRHLSDCEKSVDYIVLNGSCPNVRDTEHL